MDDLYDNLENYNEVNVVEELKNENTELKYKLEECTKAMNQLQTDFDKINNEYKKLELNYSSLLKTARAEIERKTQLITNLNKEKDMLVINSMQRGCKNVLNNLMHKVNREASNNNKKKEDIKKDADKKEDKELPNRNKAKVAVDVDIKHVSRVEAHLSSPIDSISSIGTTNKSTSSENNLQNTNDKHNSDCKENILKIEQDQQHKDNKAKTKKIMDRRKSMPVLSNWEEHFSSDEGEVNDHDTIKKDSKRISAYENKNNSDLGHGRTHKVSEQFSYDTRNKYSGERHTDKYNSHVDHYTRSHHRPYNRHSPERERYKSHRSSDHSSRSDYRHRVLKSPPSDKYNRSKSRERRHRDRDQWDYDNYNAKYNTRNEYISEERSYMKEPDHKRRRIESTSTDTERHDRFKDRKGFKHLDYVSSLNRENDTSCQSPDYDQIESNIAQHYVKEIKNTATVKLEDPRIASKKYMLNKSEEGTYITTIGKNVCMIPIDKLQWGIEKVEVPEALKEKPLTVKSNDDLVKYIYMDIDDPTRNISAKESSKIPSTDGTACVPIASDTHEQNRSDHKEDTTIIKTHHDRKTQDNIHDGTSKTLSSHYKIPKKVKADVKDNILPKDRPKDTDSHTNGKDLRNFDNTSLISSSSSLNVTMKNHVQILTSIKDNLEGDLELSDEASDTTDNIYTTVENRDKSRINADVFRDKIEDTCQDLDNPKNKTVKENNNLEECKNITRVGSNEDIKKRKECSSKLIQEIREEKTSENFEEIQDIISEINNIDKIPEENKESNNKILEEKIPKELEESKKKTSKKKCEEKIKEKLDECQVSKTQSKDTRKREKRKRASKSDSDKILQENEVLNENLDNITEQHTSSKPKNKFTELFGESNSLITPDDLGIPTKFDINNERNDNYGSLFENTQDAIDLNVREIQEIHNTEKSNSDILLPTQVLSSEDKPKTSYGFDNKSIFEIKDKSVDNIFKNLKPAVTDAEPSVVKTVVISSGIQPCVQETETPQKDLPVNKNNDETECFTNRPLGLLKAVATSTPNKMQCDSSRVTEMNTLNGESPGTDISLSNTVHSPASNINMAESNAPDVRIYLKRRRRIKKTS